MESLTFCALSCVRVLQVCKSAIWHWLAYFCILVTQVTLNPFCVTIWDILFLVYSMSLCPLDVKVSLFHALLCARVPQVNTFAIWLYVKEWLRVCHLWCVCCITTEIILLWVKYLSVGFYARHTLITSQINIYSFSNSPFHDVPYKVTHLTDYG